MCSCEPAMAAIPPYYDTDREAIETALKTIGLRKPEEARVVHIKSTLHMEIMSISKAFLSEAAAIETLHLKTELSPLAFDRDHHLILPW